MGYEVRMKALQVLLFLVGGCLAIYAGIDNGYAVAFSGMLFAFLGSVIVPEAVASLTPSKKSRASGNKDGVDGLGDDRL
jgi:hypothetical protein